MTQPEDDEGLIDLRALRLTPRHGPHAAHAPTEMSPSPYARTAYASPFASEPPPAAFASDATGRGEEKRGGGRTAIGVFAALVALAALTVGGVLVYREEYAPKTPQTAAAAPPALARSAATAAPSAARSSPPAASASAIASADPAPSPSTGKKVKKGKGKAAGGGRAAPKPAAPAAPAPPKALDPCNCNGDFQCNLKCAASR